MSNIVGDYIGQAVYFNKPVYVYRQEYNMWSSVTEEEKEANSPSVLKMYDDITKMFNFYSDSISVQQRECCDYYFGLDCVKSREKLRDIFVRLFQNAEKR